MHLKPETLEPCVHELINTTTGSLPDGQMTVSAVATLSIAISLKRIADAVCGNPERLGLVDGVMHAIEQGIILGRNA